MKLEPPTPEEAAVLLKFGFRPGVAYQPVQRSDCHTHDWVETTTHGENAKGIESAVCSCCAASRRALRPEPPK